jgi:hypothetical protein
LFFLRATINLYKILKPPTTQKVIRREFFDEFFTYESFKMALIAGAITVVANQL